MSVSGTPTAAAINIDEFERRLRAPADQQAAEDPLAEFVRFIESSGLRRGRSPAPDDTLSTPGRTDPEPTRPLETAPLRPSTVLATDEPSGTDSVDVEAPHFEFGDRPLHDAELAEFATERRSGARILKASALALAGAALIGAGFGLKTGTPRLPKVPSFVAAPQGPTAAAQLSHDIIAASTVATAIPFKDVTQPGPAKTVGSDERPTEPNAGVLLGKMPVSPAAAPVNPLVVAAPIVAPPPAASQVPDSSLVRAASPSPDATPTATASPSATDSAEAADASDAPQRPAKPVPRTGSETAAVAQPPTPKPDSPTNPSRRPSARLVVAKADATAPRAAVGRRSQPLHPGASIVTPQAPAEPQAAPPSAPAAAAQPTAPLAHAFSTIVGALGAPVASAPQPADQTAASKSGDWAVQFAAPKSEAEAKIDVARLNAKYAPALNGATIGVDKTLVNGETVYALRAAGLSKAEAAALCERVKGRDCSIAK
jgi:hypothetical protein